MASAPDPGGIFASDAHRRIMAAVPNPDESPLTVEELVTGRILLDDYLWIDMEGVVDCLQDLEADGHVEKSDEGWKNTQAGWDALTGPIANEPPPVKK